MRALLLGALLLSSCAPPSSTAVTPTPSSAPSVSFTSTPSSAATPSPFPTSTFAVDPSAPWPVVLYEGDGNVVRQRTESTSKEVARPCGELARLEARPAGLLAWCRSASPDRAELRLISIPDGRVTALASDTIASASADVSPDGRSVAAFRTGDCPMPAPVCQTRAVLIDVANKTEREILPSGYPLGATLAWTTLGLTLFQPECAEAGCAGVGDKGGTFVWDGSAFKRWSELRFVASAGSWTLLERMRSFSDRSAPRSVVIRDAQGERTLSAGHALAISDSGEALVWIPGPALLMRFAPDGRVLWQAEFEGTVLKMVGFDALIAASPASKIELYDLKRMLRFPIDARFAVAGVVR
ncbi:MAG TPA: hypothetical protein VMQ78_03510 [Candidatus Limnocylindria bacterium]|nr:hypothetical protein [Candidatus Limnocylindria bacterium]